MTNGKDRHVCTDSKTDTAGLSPHLTSASVYAGSPALGRVTSNEWQESRCFTTDVSLSPLQVIVALTDCMAERED